MSWAFGPAPLAALILTTTLAGCVSTIFESPPGEATTSCDARWVGNWEVHALDPKSESDDKVTLRVAPECKSLVIVENGTVQHDLDHAILVFASIRNSNIAALKQSPETKDTKAKTSDWETGFRYFSYTANEKEIRLQQVDDERIAKLLIEGKLLGRIERISRYPGARQPEDQGTLHNFVAGPPKEMLRALESYPLFSDKGAIILKRIADGKKRQ